MDGNRLLKSTIITPKIESHNESSTIITLDIKYYKK